MLAIDLISDQIPPLKLSDTPKTALQWMDDFKIKEIAIVDNEKYLGIIQEDDLIDMDEIDIPFSNQKLDLLKYFTYQFEHVYEVIAKMASSKLTVLPVLGEKAVYMGVVCTEVIISNISNLAAMKDPGGILEIELNVNDYSLSEISSIVESNGAKILSSYITTQEDSTKMNVTIKINKTDLSPIIQTFERYNYTIAASFHKSEMEDEMKRKFDAFLHYLNM